jgi:nucleoside-diphosphate-sugar epimerase
MYHDIAANVKPGTQLSDHVYDDLDGVAGVTSMPDGASHRDVDALVQNSFNLGVKPAIICPPTIYGETRGPAGGVSDQVPGLTRITLKKGKGITVNQGLAYWNHIHINDLGNLYLGLLEAAVDKNPKVEWNTNSYYFAESGEHIWKDVAHMLALEAHRQRLIDNGNAIESITAEEANSMEAKLGSLIGYNSRGRASRAREMFGWKPTGPALKDTLAETVKSEALKLGMKAGHAAKVSGE